MNFYEQPAEYVCVCMLGYYKWNEVGVKHLISPLSAEFKFPKGKVQMFSLLIQLRSLCLLAGNSLITLRGASFPIFSHLKNSLFYTRKSNAATCECDGFSKNLFTTLKTRVLLHFDECNLSGDVMLGSKTFTLNFASFFEEFLNGFPGGFQIFFLWNLTC